MKESYWSLVMGGGFLLVPVVRDWVVLLVPGDGGDGEGRGVHVQ